MTMVANKAAEMTPEQSLQARALDLLRTATLEVMLEADEPLRTVDAGRLVAERLGLSLNETEQGGLANVVRMVLDSDPLFSQANRQWDLALRMGRAEGDRRKPVERAIEDFIDLLGRPAPAKPVSVLVAGVYGRTPDYYEKMLERMIPRSTQFFYAEGDKIGIRRWLIEITSDEPEDVEYDNFEDLSVLEGLRNAARDAAGDDPVAYARSLVAGAGGPVDGRILQFFTWKAFPDVEPEELLRRLYRADGLTVERGPTWVTAEDHQTVLQAVRGLTAEPEDVSDLVAATAPTEDEDTGILAATTARVSDEDLDQVEDYMVDEERTFRLTELLQQVLEAFPGSRTFGDMQESLRGRMREDDRFQWVGFDRFRMRGTIPAEVEALPPALAFDESVFLDDEGEEIDKIVPVQDWKAGLDEQIRHYQVQDVGDDSTAPPSSTPTQLESSVPLHQYVAGVRYLRNADRGFFPAEPDIVQASIIPTQGEPFEVWVNNRLQLIFGLKDWYEANLPWVGGKFTLERGEQPDEFRLVYNNETDELMDVGLPRLQQLLALRGEAQNERLPLSEVVNRILKDHPEGIHFVTLFTEVNVVRRIRRAQLASVLSSQRYYAQTPSGLWSYDEKRAARPKGKKKGPKRPMRDYEDDLDDDIEYE